MKTWVVPIPLELLIKPEVAELAALNVIAPPVLLPNWLLLMFITVVTFPVFCMAVKPPVVAVVVLLLKIFPLADKVLMAPLLAMPTIAEPDDAPDIAQFRMLLLFI